MCVLKYMTFYRTQILLFPEVNNKQLRVEQEIADSGEELQSNFVSMKFPYNYKRIVYITLFGFGINSIPFRLI
jgi:hypothetical protein